MPEDNHIPYLLQFLFGEAAVLAFQGASPRLLRWSQAIDDWLAERQRKFTHRTFMWSLNAWKRLLSRCRQPPWEIRPEDVRKHVDWMQARGYAANTIKTELGMLVKFYEWYALRKIDPECGRDFNPVTGMPKPKVAHTPRQLTG